MERKEIPCRLKVEVVRAKRLRAADTLRKKSDPYVTLKVNDITKKSTFKANTLQPEWREMFIFDNIVEPETTEMIIDVWDRDLLLKNDVIGSARLSLHPDNFKQGKVNKRKITLTSKKSSKAGVLYLKLTPIDFGGKRSRIVGEENIDYEIAAGPLLSFRGQALPPANVSSSDASYNWAVSLMLVVAADHAKVEEYKKAHGADSKPPIPYVVSYKVVDADNKKDKSATDKVLDPNVIFFEIPSQKAFAKEYRNSDDYLFVRYEFNIPQTKKEQYVKYYIDEFSTVDVPEPKPLEPESESEDEEDDKKHKKAKKDKKDKKDKKVKKEEEPEKDASDAYPQNQDDDEREDDDIKEKIVSNGKTGYRKSYNFFVPALGSSAKMMYCSCNGFQKFSDEEAMRGIQPLWKDFNKRHYHQGQFHLWICGGDLLYTDGSESMSGVLKLPSIVAWTKERAKKRSSLNLTKYNEYLTNDCPFTEEMKDEVDSFMLRHYIRHFNETEFKQALALVPSLMNWDDHDIFDGCGSYPPVLQNTGVLRGIFNIARRYYLLFQHHTTEELLDLNEKSKDVDNLHSNLFIGYPSMFSFVKIVNEGEILLLGPDTRSQRRIDRIISDENWALIWAELRKVLKNLQQNPHSRRPKHIMNLLSIPVVWPDLSMFETGFVIVDNVRVLSFLANKAGGVNEFGMMELRDDGADHWGAKPHREERRKMIDELANIMKEFSVRVTLYGGDVHCGGAGAIYPKGGLKDKAKPAATNQVMFQITSSAIGNVPPPNEAFIQFLNKQGKSRQKLTDTLGMRLIGYGGYGKQSLFGKVTPAKLIVGARNYTIVQSNNGWLCCFLVAEAVGEDENQVLKLLVPEHGSQFDWKTINDGRKGNIF